MSADRPSQISRRDFLKLAAGGAAGVLATSLEPIALIKAQESSELPHPLTLEAIEVSYLPVDGNPDFARPGENQGFNTLENPVFGTVRESIEAAVTATSRFIAESPDSQFKNIREVTAVTIGDVARNSDGGLVQATPTAPNPQTGRVPVLITSMHSGFFVDVEGKVTSFTNEEWASQIGGIPGGSYMFPSQDGTLTKADFRGVVFATGHKGEDSTYRWSLPESGPWVDHAMTEQEYVSRNEAVSTNLREYQEIVQSRSLQFDPENYAYEYRTETGERIRFRKGMGITVGADGTYHSDDLRSGWVKETSRFSETVEGKTLTIVLEGQENATGPYSGAKFKDEFMADTPEAQAARQVMAEKFVQYYPALWAQTDEVSLFVPVVSTDMSQSRINRYSEGGLATTNRNVSATGHNQIDYGVYEILVSTYHNENFAINLFGSLIYELRVLTGQDYLFSADSPATRSVKDMLGSISSTLGEDIEYYRPLETSSN